MKEVVELLIKKHKTISTMESCTGGGVANAITSIEGASEILKFSAVTYSNEFKIKMGVNKDKQPSFFSFINTNLADVMSRNISNFTNSDYGVGITGKLNRVDVNNPYGEDNVVFVSIYDKENNSYIKTKVEATASSRAENKLLVIDKIKELLLKTIK